MGKPVKKEEMSFDLERFVQVTDQDKYNLLMLRTLKNIKWYVETKTKKAGDGFSEGALTWDIDAEPPKYKERIVSACPKASLIFLSQDDFK